MHWPERIFYGVLTVLHAVEATSSASHDQSPEMVANWNYHSMRRSVAGGGIPGGGRKRLPISLGFKCAYCRGEFGSREGMDCHRQHPNSIGTPCADPMNSKSMSLTQREDSYTGTLRIHDTLGVYPYMHQLDLVMIRPPGIDNGAFVVSPNLNSVWYARVLLLFSACAMTDTGSKSFEYAFVSTLETYNDPNNCNYEYYIYYIH